MRAPSRDLGFTIYFNEEILIDGTYIPPGATPKVGDLLKVTSYDGDKVYNLIVTSTNLHFYDDEWTLDIHCSAERS